MRGDVGLADPPWICAGRVQKSTAGAASAIHGLFVEREEIVGVVVVLLADHIDETGPAVANADNLIPFANGAKGDTADGWIEAGNVTASGKDADDAFPGADVSHEMTNCPFVGYRTRNYPLLKSF
jgi:hypothetical protein